MKQDSRCANLMGNGRYCLQPTTAITPFNVQQKVEASIKNHKEIMVTEIEVNAEGMQLIGLTPFGHQLVHISYNNEKAKAVVSPDSRLDPTLMIAMIQLALWPVDSVRKGLGEPLLLEESIGHRRYLARDKLVLDVSYANAMVPSNKLNLSFPTVGLMLDIESLPEIERLQ
jgi:hypothetical protein